MNDPLDPQTESQIRRALSARAEEIRVSPDALDRIRSRRPASPWARPAAYAAVAAIVVVLLVGVAVLTNPGDDGASIDDPADETTTLPPETTVPTTTEPPSTTSTVPADPGDPFERRSFYGPVTFEDRGGDAWVAGPLPSSGRLVREIGTYWPTDGRTFDDAQSLTAAYLDEVHGITDPIEITSVGYNVAAPETGYPSDPDVPIGYQRTTESGEGLGGDPLGMGMLVGTATDTAGDWVIGQVVTDRLWLDGVEASAESQGVLRIRGGGEAFEGAALLTVDDADPVIISVGAFGPDTFSVLVPYDGRDLVRITLESTDPIDGSLPNVLGVVATVESVDGPLDSSAPSPTPVTYSVFGVADDDVLNVRDGAGVDNPIITTFPPDATGIVVTGREEFVGSARWWEVETEDARGWVHSQFLVADADLSNTPGLETRILEEFVMQARTLDPALFDDVVEFGGIGVYADFPTPWTTVASDEFDVARNWSPVGTEDRCPECTATVEEFLGFATAKWELATYTLGSDIEPTHANYFFESGQFPDFHGRFVTATIHIPEPNPDVSLDWRRYTLVFDFEDDEPRIRGIWRWGWTP